MLKNLLLFGLTTVIYFYCLPSLKPSLWAVVIKCLPVLSLAAAVHFEGKKQSKSSYARLITYGLLSSSVGDAFLVWHQLFPLGMVAFAIAHCFYIKAFGFRPLKLSIGFTLLILSGIVMTQVLPNIKDETLFYGIPVYGLFLTTMSWRALARMSDDPDAWSYPKIICALGSILFIISDTTICFHDLQKPVPYGQIIIMSTYYLSQLGLALSIKSNFSSVNNSMKDK